jgi:Domain of unknown function (DUF4263)
MPREVKNGAPETWAEYEDRVNQEFHRNGYDKHCAWSGTREVTTEEVADFRTVLESARDERPLQEYLAKHPSLLAGEIGRQCRWVIPQPNLAGRFIPDFMVARLDSGGVKWALVELETPAIESLFTKDGHPRKQLRQGVKQIQDWRFWFEENLAMARQPPSRGGLGLVDVYAAMPGIVIIGRAHDRVDKDRSGRLRKLEGTHNIEVWSYDRLLREAEDRVSRLASSPSDCDECVEA